MHRLGELDAEVDAELRAARLNEGDKIVKDEGLIAKLEALDRAATSAPWEWRKSSMHGPPHDDEDGGIETRIIETDGGFYPPLAADRALIAAARNALPSLLARIAELEAGLIDAGALHLADEQTVRNLEAKLAVSERALARMREQVAGCVVDMQVCGGHSRFLATLASPAPAPTVEDAPVRCGTFSGEPQHERAISGERWRWYGREIRAARERCQLSMGDLARRLGVATSVVSDVERGIEGPVPASGAYVSREEYERATECAHFRGAKAGYTFAAGDKVWGLCGACKEAMREVLGLIACDEGHATYVAEADARVRAAVAEESRKHAEYRVMATRAARLAAASEMRESAANLASGRACCPDCRTEKPMHAGCERARLIALDIAALPLPGAQPEPGGEGG